VSGRDDFITSMPASPHQVPEVEPLLRRVVELLEAARPMPLSTSVMIQKDEILELLDEALERLPEELRAARWLLKEREEFLVKVRREGDDILDEARGQAARMVERTEVVKHAEQRGRQIIEAAEEEARRMRHQVEDFCDQRLSSFEAVLERTMAAVQAGRERLQATAPAPAANDDLAGIEDFSPSTEGSGGFFDQDV
jgi:dsDNA-specific endonuclease/ATPase MutS2